MVVGVPDGRFRVALIGALGSEGFVVEQVTDALALVESLAREPAHLLVLGRDFSGFPGFELCRTLKADPGSFLPIIAVAPDDASPESERLAWEAGVDHFFGRGCDLANLTLLLDGANKGTGLGLAFCRNVILAHGGRIWVDSADEGCVAFAFTLPGAESQAA